MSHTVKEINIYEILDKIEFEKHIDNLSKEINDNIECASSIYLSNSILFLMKEFKRELIVKITG